MQLDDPIFCTGFEVFALLGKFIKRSLLFFRNYARGDAGGIRFKQQSYLTDITRFFV